MNTKVMASILLTALILGGIAIGLNWVTQGLEIFGWLVVLVGVVFLVWVWIPRKGASNP